MPVTLVEQEPGCGPPAPVPILQWQREFETLLELYRRFSPFSVLEVGTYHGGTLYHWLQRAVPGAEIVTVDSYDVGVDNSHLYKKWQPMYVHLKVIKGNSHDDEIVEQIRGHGPYDWVFIDAGHYLAEVTRDWELYRPMVSPGGICVFHDILTHPAWPSIEVGQLWDRIRQQHLTFEIVQDRDAEWGGLGIVLL